ncbi:MAG: adenylate kinase [Candidatus Lokiarchaeota archaeon]|nr:adenylate kinase [Candidatus Lokiarchaeota archaeon]
MARLIFLGLPGAGKGTQSEILESKFNIPQISTGDILREHVRKGTELGNKAKSYMDEGKLVPNNLIIKMMEKRLKQDDCSEGFILDGFPRTIEQAEVLESITDIDKVIYIDVPVDELIDRLTGRRVCENCNAVYHIKYNPPKKPGVCDECGGKLIQRKDDKKKIVKKRIKAYNSQTKPLVEYYRKKGILKTIDGDRDEEGIDSINAVANDIEKVVKGLRID